MLTTPTRICPKDWTSGSNDGTNWTVSGQQPAPWGEASKKSYSISNHSCLQPCRIHVTANGGGEYQAGELKLYGSSGWIRWICHHSGGGIFC